MLSGVLVLSCLVALPFVALTLAQLLLGWQSYSVLSGSMSPTIPTGALVITRPVAADQVKRGDIITFNPPSDPAIYVTHRVYSVTPAAAPDPGVIQTKGDANSSPDTWQLPARGRVHEYLAHLPLAGYISSNLQTPGARVAFLVVPGIFLCVLLLIEIWRPRPQLAGAPAGMPVPVHTAGSGNWLSSLRLGAAPGLGWNPDALARVAPPLALALTGLLFVLQPLLQQALPLQLFAGVIALAAGVGLSVVTWRHRPVDDWEMASGASRTPRTAAVTKQRPWLTPRERQVLSLIARGLDAYGIAERLEMTRSEVVRDLENARTRLGAESDLEAALTATRKGLLR